MGKRRSSLVAVHADKNAQQGSVPASGIFILVAVLAAISAVWINEFMIDESEIGETTVYRTGGAGRSGSSRKIHYAVPAVSSLKDCEKILSEALKDYVEKQAAVAAIDDDDDEDEKPRKKASKKSKKDDDSAEEVKAPKKDSGKKKSKK
ncbi:uncharacterized protein LOC100906280 [Galendromus occidentalis]|uniref:Uncharacterized protein LOC100906280 n=1 Tax=Galendromus occidentalis TaxID=34638 RepID=A0AAJ6W0D7_9ACAR|nr:uncharacterized protein LOC100906280 [Galendromus occidentalis]